MERKHMNETPTNGVCLADRCEMFQVCQGYIKYPPRLASPVGSVGIGESWQPPACQNETMARERRRCEESLKKCLPLVEDKASRQIHAYLSRHFCQTLDCHARLEQHLEQHTQMIPTIVWVSLIGIACFLIFALTVCCVEHSDDVLKLFVGAGLISTDVERRVTRARETTRRQVGMDRTKGV